MRKKIGEVLIDKGLITSSQLSTALTAQLVYGGHLGTCLIELGMIDEDALGQALSDASRAPYAPPSLLYDIPRDTIKAFPRRMAELHSAVPLKCLDSVLHLAMIEPRNIRAIDEIAFVTGCRIEPWVSPEVRIYQALERYYGTPRRLRYINICRILEIQAQRLLHGEGLATPPLVLRGPGPGIQQEWRSGAEIGTVHGGDAGAQRGGTPALRGHEGSADHGAYMTPDDEPSAPSMPDLGGEYGYGRPWKEIASELDADSPAQQSVSARRGVVPQGPSREGIQPTLWDTTERLCRAETKQEAVDALLDHTAARMTRSLFFGVNDHVVTVYESRGSDFDRRRKAKSRFSVTSEKIFQLMMGNEYYRGPLPDRQAVVEFYKTLGMPAPKDVLMFPVYLDDHLVAIFYGDGGVSGTIAGDTDEYLRLFRVFSYTVDLLLLKERIRSVGWLFGESETGHLVGTGAGPEGGPGRTT